MSNPYDERSLNDWLIDLECRNTQEIQLGLERVRAVAEKLHLRQWDCPIILVAGTNGKGSTVAALEALYHAANYRVGAYTSPHLIEYNERIRVNRDPISNKDLCSAFSQIDYLRQGIVLTYFEMTTLAALWHFRKHNLDVMILEVGLGGRLDATNIIDADVSIITTVDFDHQDYLGSTLDDIGYEKAGILRQGKPFIYADSNPPSTVIDAAMQLETQSFFYGKEYDVTHLGTVWNMCYLQQQISELPIPAIQLKSAAAALLATLLLKHQLPITLAHIQDAMRSVFIPGRLQLFQGKTDILLDVSHNPQSVRLLAQRLAQFSSRKIHAVFSALKDKDIPGLILPLRGCVDYWYPAQLDNKRAAAPDLLLAHFEEAEIFVKICYTSPLIAFEAALNQAEEGDLIVVYGSFFTVSQVIRRCNETGN